MIFFILEPPFSSTKCDGSMSASASFPKADKYNRRDRRSLSVSDFDLSLDASGVRVYECTFVQNWDIIISYSTLTSYIGRYAENFTYFLSYRS